eukprot:214420-Karenia_brevis.AAC.1
MGKLLARFARNTVANNATQGHYAKDNGFYLKGLIPGQLGCAQYVAHLDAFSINDCPFLLGMRTGAEPEDFSFLKAAFPDQKDCAIMD